METTSFYGQQEGERILYEARPDKIRFYLAIGQIAAAVVFLLIIILVISNSFPAIASIVALLGMILGFFLVFAALWTVLTQSKKNVTYITDRRVIRFISTSPWTTNSRSLFWDEVVKIKTFSTNWILRMLNVGSVIVHARTNTTPTPGSDEPITSDDLLINDISYFADLGNYMDKILFLYKQKRDADLASLRPFVAKPKGKRY